LGPCRRCFFTFASSAAVDRSLARFFPLGADEEVAEVEGGLVDTGTARIGAEADVASPSSSCSSSG
jgi:hypothetical protein